MMIDFKTYIQFLAVMTGVTYLLRAVPFVLLKKELTSPFWKSFLAYIPYTVLAAMTVPAIFYATESRLSGICALVTAVIASLLGRGLVVVAVVACVTVLLVDGLL
ncbi:MULTISPECIES: AzlD domain-containing protein [unclassified Fibrobacter]|uniref:AzlD domain-containing protein n=1 Tax=unclassified Fibrobacter TaxID=2634177 RepID=UPI000D6B808D|nr:MULTISPECIES: AzlD domain-containing protein [unclassified Fibrobacter]PWJ64057.1 branched-subunit amino acid transport protein [Fibrobacter sp. UWR4]PZW69206.1 branched-subunit amino acid transport protein [Fibrobacter sp. UWR1]